MKADADGIVRTNWLPDDASDESVRSSGAPALKGVEVYADHWSVWLEHRAEEAAEAQGDDEPPVDPLLVEALGALQRATDRSLGHLERQLSDRFGAEIYGLRAKVAELEDARRADEQRHRREVARLVKRLETFETTIRADVGEAHDAVRLIAAESAESRAVERLRQSSWMKLHNARVGQRIVERELANAKG